MIRRILFSAALWAILSSLPTAIAIGDTASQTQNQTSALLGCWQCQKAGVSAALIFHSPNHLSQDGEHYQYMLIPGAIRVSDGYESADYSYRTDGIRLMAIYPDGSQIYCVRSDCSSLVSAGNRSTNSQSGGNSPGPYNNGIEMPDYNSGSWETESDRQYYDESAGYGGGAYENPTSNYYNEE